MSSVNFTEDELLTIYMLAETEYNKITWLENWPGKDGYLIELSNIMDKADK